MCGRFAQTPIVQAIFSRYTFIGEDPAGVVPRFNIAPTQPVPVIFRDEEGDHLHPMRWGLVPHWSKEIGTRPLFNARGETVAEKPSFRTAFKKRRCIVPATGFYEWKKEPGTKKKTPHFIHMKGETPMVFAGLWEHWNNPEGGDLNSFTIITTTPNAVMEPLHDRMPVILSEDDETAWLDPDNEAEQLHPLIKPCEDDLIEAYPVAPDVGSATHEDEDCIKPAPTQGDLF